MTDLATEVGSVVLPNPIMTASGTAGHGVELGDYGDLSELGAVVVKSVSIHPWAGNPAPRVHEVGSGMLNSVGLQGPGLAAWITDDLPALAGSGARVVVSIWGQSVDEYAKAAAMLAEVVQAGSAGQAGSAIVAVEVNVSCPNVEDRSRMFAHSETATARVVAATECGLPRWVKLSPNVPDIAAIAGAALGTGRRRHHPHQHPPRIGARPRDRTTGARGRRRRALRRRPPPGGRARGVGVPQGIPRRRDHRRGGSGLGSGRGGVPDGRG